MYSMGVRTATNILATAGTDKAYRNKQCQSATGRHGKANERNARDDGVSLVHANTKRTCYHDQR